jgi:hypothetical protein
VASLAVESLVDAGEDLVGFVDHAQVEGFGILERDRARLAARQLAPGQKDPGAVEGAGSQAALPGLDSEQRVELLPPLPEQWLGHDGQHAPGSLGQ